MNLHDCTHTDIYFILFLYLENNCIMMMVILLNHGTDACSSWDYLSCNVTPHLMQCWNSKLWIILWRPVIIWSMMCDDMICDNVICDNVMCDNVICYNVICVFCFTCAAFSLTMHDGTHRTWVSLCFLPFLLSHLRFQSPQFSLSL